MGSAERCSLHEVYNCFACFYRSPHMVNDKPKVQIEKIIRERNEKGWTCFAKWTCERCGKRCASKEPNVVREEQKCDCGHISHPVGFGVMIAKEVPDNG